MTVLPIPYKDSFCECLYDHQDEFIVGQYEWYILNGYAVTYINGRIVSMSRLILGLSDPKTFADHKDGNRLNNRRDNLRACTPSENRRNSRKEKGCTSIYKGCYFETERGLYHSQIGFATKNKTKVYNLGRFSDERLAGKAYDKLAVQLFGEFAHVNFPSSREAAQLKFPWAW